MTPKTEGDFMKRKERNAQLGDSTKLMSDVLENASFDMLEDQADIKAADEAYEAYLADPETISMAEMKKKYSV